MANGEVVFEAPWEGRVFGIAHTLAASGLFTWDEFREQLIEAVDGHDERRAYRYYEYFQQALVTVLCRKGVLDAAEVELQVRELEARPPDHDHHH